jgi:bacteriorhodopsin
VWLSPQLSFFALSFAARAGEKIFHYLFTIALLVGSIAYFANASDLAWVVVEQANELENGTRQIFWAKYVNWAVSFPVLSITLGLLSGVSWATIFYQVALSWTWVISYLVAAFTATNYKWGFFAFGTVSWLFLAASTLKDGHTGASRVGVSRDFTLLSGWTNFLWLLYPIAWGISDGGNRIGVTSSFIYFGILDILLVPLVAFAVLFFSRNWDYGRLNIAFTQYGRVNAPAGTFPEKNTTAAPAAGGVTAENTV